MKFRLFLSLFIIIAVSTTAFASTKALLSDSASLTANTFSTGTVDLQIATSTSVDPQSGSFADTKTGFTDKLLPGQTSTELFWLKNHSTDIDFAIAGQSIITAGGTIDPTKITVTFTPVSNDGTSSTGSPVAHTLSEWTSLASLNNTLVHNVNTGRQRYKMDVALASDVTTAGTISFDFVFTGTQVNP